MTAVVVAIGPQGGKIVGWKQGKPIYAHEEEAKALAPNAHAQSPFAAAQAAGLSVMVHPFRHDMVQIAWRNTKAAAAQVWFQDHAQHLPPGTEASKSSISSILLVPRAWAEAELKKPGPEPAKEPPKASAPRAPKAKPGPKVPAGWKAADPGKLKNSVKSWHFSARHPVTVAGLGDAVFAGRIVLDVGAGALTDSAAVQTSDGKLHQVPLSDVTPKAGVAIRPPWADCVVMTHPEVGKQLAGFVAAPLKGANKAGTLKDAMGDFTAAGFPVFVWGGAVRDAVQGKAPKDIDCAFIASVGQFKHVATQHGWGTTWANGKTGLCRIGSEYHEKNAIEGKPVWGSDGMLKSKEPRSIGGDLRSYSERTDFTFNAMAYDPINETVIDPSGQGVADAKDKVIRPVVPKERWAAWLEDNPSLVVRYFKFRGNGYEPAPGVAEFFQASATKALAAMGAKAVGKMVSNGSYNTTEFKAAVIAEMGADWYHKHF